MRLKLVVFVLSGMYAGLAGALLGIFQSYMPPDVFSLDTSGQLVFQTVIGGLGTLLGPTVGAAVWLLLRTWLQQIPLIGALWKFILGGIFVLLVTLLRKGIYGTLLSLWQSSQVRTAPDAAAAPQRARKGLADSLAAATRPASHAGHTPWRRVTSASPTVRFTPCRMSPSQYTEGELYAVIGPNGAGKSTFLRLLSGEEIPVTGNIFLHGQDVTRHDVTAANQSGIAKSYQINQLFTDLTVRENLRISALARKRGPLRFDIFRPADSLPQVEQVVAALLDELGLTQVADLPVHTLAYGEKRRIEVGLALASLPSVLLLDEPLAGLSPQERQDITQLICRLRAGRTIVLVEHDMDAVFALATRITVLHDGRHLAEGTPAEIRQDSRVREAYLGGVRR